MPILKETVRLALKEQAPQLYRQLERSGKLASFVKEQADALNAEIHDAMMQRMMEPDMQALPDLERPKRAAALDQAHTQIALAQMAFPSAETSPPSPGETTASQAPTT